MAEIPPNNPYQTPVTPKPTAGTPKTDYAGPAPSVVTWQKVYIGLMMFLYIAVAIGGACCFFFAEDIARNDPSADPQLFRILGVIYGLFSFAFALLFAAGLVWSRGMAGWIVNLILIVLGLTSCITWPMTIPLIIYWIKHKDWIVGPPKNS